MKYSIIIPTYNHCDDLLKPCVDSILEHTTLDDNAEIIIVANGCLDNTKEYLDSLKNSNIKLVWVSSQLGYTKAVNIGIKASAGEYIIFLNNDIIMLSQNKNEWLDKLQKLWDSKEATGVVGIFYDYTYERKWVSFYCAMTSRKVIDKIGMLDEMFITGGEDIDFCFRAEEAGYGIIAEKDLWDKNLNRNTTTFPMYHKQNGTIGDNLEQYTVDVTRAFKILDEKYKKIKQVLKLNLGCGDEILDGYINCDLSNIAADMLFDARSIPFPDNSVDEIRAYHIIEHFNILEAFKILQEWKRVLKENGKLVLETPDFIGLCRRFLESDDYVRSQFLYPRIFPQSEEQPGSNHLFLFTEYQLFWTLEVCGYKGIIRMIPDSTYFKQTPDMQDIYLNVTAYKPKELIKNNKKIAILMPAYNSGFMIEKTLNGIVNQKFTGWELIIVNDGSTDTTLESIKKYQLIDERIHYINHTENKGISNAFNTAIEWVLQNDDKYKFTHISFSSSNDIWYSNHLEESLKYFNSDDKPDMVYSMMDFENLEGVKQFSWGIPFELEPTLDNLLLHNFILAPTVIITIDCLKTVGYYDGTLDSIEDWDYWLRIAEHGFKIKKINNTYSKYIINENGLGSKKTPEKLEIFLNKHKKN